MIKCSYDTELYISHFEVCVFITVKMQALFSHLKSVENFVSQQIGAMRFSCTASVVHFFYLRRNFCEKAV